MLLDAISTAGSSGVLPVDDPLESAGSLWSVVHGTATLAIGRDLQHTGITTPAEDLAALTIAALLR